MTQRHFLEELCIVTSVEEYLVTSVIHSVSLHAHFVALLLLKRWSVVSVVSGGFFTSSKQLSLLLIAIRTNCDLLFITSPEEEFL